jgi:hypothetical protein
MAQRTTTVFVVYEEWPMGKGPLSFDGRNRVGNQRGFFMDRAAAERRYQSSDATVRHLYTEEASFEGRGRRRVMIPHPKTRVLIATSDPEWAQTLLA